MSEVKSKIIEQIKKWKNDGGQIAHFGMGVNPLTGEKIGDYACMLGVICYGNQSDERCFFSAASKHLNLTEQEISDLSLGYYKGVSDNEMQRLGKSLWNFTHSKK